MCVQQSLRFCLISLHIKVIIKFIIYFVCPKNETTDIRACLHPRGRFWQLWAGGFIEKVQTCVMLLVWVAIVWAPTIISKMKTQKPHAQFLPHFVKLLLSRITMIEEIQHNKCLKIVFLFFHPLQLVQRPTRSALDQIRMASFN